ncbi:MAG: tetratricopeptide repeat protein [Acidobacteriaceae bacterium]|nr:tetratricopeptide repeat protein [Acidobacteriaceae bacterium]
MKRLIRYTSWATLLVCTTRLFAERGVLVVHIEDVHRHPISGVRLRAGDSSVGSPTDSFGAARIRLAANAKPGDVVMLEIVATPNGKDLVMVSPWEEWVNVPPFENEAKNFVPIVLVEWSDKACLENSDCIRAAAAQINKASAPKGAGERNREEQLQEARSTISKKFGLKPEEIDQAIREWGEKTEDPYDKGLAALYEKRYPEASAEFAASLDRRKRVEARAQADVVDAALFLGQSLFQQGHYRQSAEAYEEAAARRPDEGAILNRLGLSWALAGDYARAEPLYIRAIALEEKEPGPVNSNVATYLDNLAILLQAKGDYAGAEPLFRRALAIDENVFGPDHLDVARDLNNLGSLLQAKGDYKSAEPLYRRALALAEKNLQPEDPHVATSLSNLAGLLQIKGDYSGAESLYRRALAIDEREFGPDHPEVATDLNNLAGALHVEHNYATAEPLYRRAVTIDEKALGPDHPGLAEELNNLASLLQSEGENDEAERLYRRSIAIKEEVLGPDHPSLATGLSNLAGLLQSEGKYDVADVLFRRALAIDEKSFGAGHPEVAVDLVALASLLQAEGDLTGAEPLLRRALAIDEKELGPDHPSTKGIRTDLELLVERRPSKP